MKKNLAAIPAQVSIVVCTFNRARQLETALGHLRKAAENAPVTVEIVIVDNNSKDDTRVVVESATPDFPVPLRYAVELTQGLASARNRGIQESTGLVIGFTDDDCIVDTRWIAALWHEFLTHPDIGVLGGRVDLYSPEDHGITIRTGTERVRYREATQVYSLIIGCNMAVRRETIERIGMFDPAFGVGGVTADDIEYVYRALRSGVGVLYTPEPRVCHNHGRRTRKDLEDVGRSYIKGRGAFYCKYLLKADPVIVRHTVWELWSMFRAAPASPYTLSNRAAFAALVQGALHFLRVRARVF